MSGLFFNNSPSKIISIESGFFKYEIGSDGQNLYFINKSTGKDYLDSDNITKCAYISVEGEMHEVTTISLNSNHLRMKFEDAGAEVELQIMKSKNGVTLNSKI